MNQEQNDLQVVILSIIKKIEDQTDKLPKELSGQISIYLEMVISLTPKMPSQLLNGQMRNLNLLKSKIEKFLKTEISPPIDLHPPLINLKNEFERLDHTATKLFYSKLWREK